MNKLSVSKTTSLMLSLVCALLVAVLVSTSAYGQVAGATLSGTVKDPSGAVIPGAKVLIVNTATGVKTAVTTNSAGLYGAPNLLPGKYTATVTASGFQTSVQSGITLVVGGHVISNFTLQIGKTTQTVHVSGAVASAIQLASPSVSATVNERTITTLPLNGRDWTLLATLQPGVSVVRSQGNANSPLLNRGNRGYGNQLTDSGHSPYENVYRTDGIMVNDYSNGAPGSVIGVNLGVDAIQEFSVETSTYSAKYGMAAGAVINSITKSGTNQFHGGAYGFLRDEGLDAKSYFVPAGTPNPPFHRNIFGIDAGGPIVKDKMFIFGDYEAIRQNQAVTFSNNVLSADAQNGVFGSGAPLSSNACPSGSSLIDPGVSNTCVANGVIPYFALWPHQGQNVPGTFGAVTGYTQIYSVATGAPYSENYYTARFDADISAADKFTASFFYDKSPQTVPDSFSYTTLINNSIREMYELSETHIFSSAFVNTARFGFARVNGYDGKPGTALNPVAADSSLGLLPGRNGPLMFVPGLTLNTTLGSTGYNNFWFNTFQFYDDAFWVHGNHSMQFGFSSIREQHNHFLQFNHTGKVFFGTFADFLAANPSLYIIQAPQIAPKIHLRQTAFGVYFDDTWHVRSNLTATLGMRWEPTTLPTNAGIPFQVLTPITAPTLTTQSTLWTHNASLHDFEPRVGLAWDPFGTGKTSIRAGFGVYDLLPLPWVYLFNEVGSKAPFFYTNQAAGLGPGTFPNLPPALLSSSNVAVVHIQQHPKVAYNLVWSLTVQRSLTPSLTATIGYVGSRGVHLPTTPDDANWSLPTFSSAAGGYLWPCAPKDTNGNCTLAGAKLNPNVGSISPVFWMTSSKYNGLQLGLTKSMSHGLEFQGSYTWSKCTDTNSAYGIPDQFTNAIPAEGGDFMYFDPALTNGLCDFSLNQNFTLSGIWDVPTGGHLTKGLNYILGGWQVGGILTAQSGVPFSVLIAGDPLRRNAGDSNSDQPNRIPGCNPVTGNINAYINMSCFTVPTAPAAAAAQCNTNGFGAYNGVIPSGQVICANLFGNAGRNTLIGPKLINVDFSVYKNVPITAISEAFNVQFRASFFNVFNHPNFLPPVDNAIIFGADGSAVSGAGRIDSTSTNNRQVQLGLRVTW